MSSTGTRLLLLVSATLALAAVWLAFDNPNIGHTSRSDDYTCLAPWDTVLNDASNFPGGDPPPDGEDIASRCREAGHGRFGLALAGGSGAVVLAAVTGVLSRRRSRRPSNRSGAPDGR